MKSLLLLLGVLGTVFCEERGKLVMTHLVWSQGSSTPQKVIPSDKVNTEESWSEGLGTLTKTGREEALALGTLLHERYVNLLGALSPGNIHKRLYVRSSDYNASLSTAYAVLAGLLPMAPADLGTKAWPLYWLPFPVHSVPLSQDSLLNAQTSCPTVQERIPSKLIQSPVFQDQSNLQFLEFILTKSGFPELTWDTLLDIYNALEATKNAHSGNHTWPLWMDNEGFAKLKSLVDFSAATAFSDPGISRLRGGALLYDIKWRMKTKAKCLTEVGNQCRGVNELGIYAYSTDSLVLHGLLSALGHLSGSIPGKAAVLALELWSRPEGGHEVRVLYNDGSGKALTEIPVGGCEELGCELKAFEDRSKDYIPWNWEKECGLITEGLNPECAVENDNSESASCRDWASHGLCTEQPAVRFVFCRATCLCDERFAKQRRKFRLV